jgi:hypothetical protein
MQVTVMRLSEPPYKVSQIFSSAFGGDPPPLLPAVWDGRPGTPLIIHHIFFSEFCGFL